MQADKRNVERTAEAVPDSDDRVLQNFLTHSSWEYRGVMNRVARRANESVGAEEGTGLYIDESAFQKKGDKSFGVARQWNGRLGKHENSHVSIPKAQQVHRTKLELALDIIRHARQIGVRFE